MKADNKTKKAQVEDKKAVVTYGLGVTLNAGNFESVKINFSLSLECYESELNKTIDTVKEKVQKQIKEEILKTKKLIEG